MCAGVRSVVSVTQRSCFGYFLVFCSVPYRSSRVPPFNIASNHTVITKWRARGVGL